MKKSSLSTNIALRYALVLVCGLVIIAYAAPIGYLARWIPTWLAISLMSLSVLIPGILLGKRLGWMLLWACTLAISMGIGGAVDGSNDRKEAAADELGPVPLSVIEERSDHEAFYLKDIRLGEMEYEFTYCDNEGDCYYRVLISMRPHNATPETPINHWIQASQDSAFDGRYIFSRISYTYHEPEQLQAACKARRIQCSDHDQTAFFEPIEPRLRKLSGDQTQSDSDLFVGVVLVTFLWGIPVLIAFGRAWWRRSLGKP